MKEKTDISIWIDGMVKTRGGAVFLIILIIVLIVAGYILLKPSVSEEELLLNGISNSLKSVRYDPSYEELIEFRDDIEFNFDEYVNAKSKYNSEGDCSGIGCKYDPYWR